MSGESEKTTRELIELFRARDLESLMARVNPACVIVSRRSALEGEFVGHEGLRRWAQELYEWLPDIDFRFDQLRAIEDGRVLLLGRQYGTARAGGTPVDEPLALIIELDEAGLLRRVTAFATHAAALEAAGLSQ